MTNERRKKGWKNGYIYKCTLLFIKNKIGIEIAHRCLYGHALKLMIVSCSSIVSRDNTIRRCVLQVQVVDLDARSSLSWCTSTWESEGGQNSVRLARIRRGTRKKGNQLRALLLKGVSKASTVRFSFLFFFHLLIFILKKDFRIFLVPFIFVIHIYIYVWVWVCVWVCSIYMYIVHSRSISSRLVSSWGVRKTNGLVTPYGRCILLSIVLSLFLSIFYLLHLFLVRVCLSFFLFLFFLSFVFVYFQVSFLFIFNSGGKKRHTPSLYVFVIVKYDGASVLNDVSITIGLGSLTLLHR